MTYQAWQPRNAPAPEQLDWAEQVLRAGLQEILGWSRQRSLPAVYSCNPHDVWPSTGHGHSSVWERDNRTGQNRLLDQIHRSAIRSRPEGGRFEIMADGAYWVESGRQFAVWTYVNPTSLAEPSFPQGVGTNNTGVSVSVQKAMEILASLGFAMPPAETAAEPVVEAEDPDTLVLQLKEDVDWEIKFFVERMVESLIEDCTIWDGEESRVERTVSWKEFLRDYIDGGNLLGGICIDLLGDYSSPAAKKIKRIAKSHYDDLVWE